MRVAVYNQMFGLNGRSFFDNIIGHYYVHFQRNPEKVFERTNLKETFKIVKKSKADIIGICEIYEGQEKEISEGLKRLGYKYFYFGRGYRFKFNDRHVIELIASKFKGKQLKYKMWPVENKLGGGGGFVVCRFSRLNIFHVHLATPTNHFSTAHIEYTQKIIRKLKGKIIFMGDFNYPFNYLKNYFPDFKLVTKEIKTCSLTPVLKWFYNKDVDHIFVRGFKCKKLGTLEGRSDHKLIYADLE